ncbi:hypothetical protein SpCBS45565_g07180 [Spizellomyces sp. 'palustris']|nr:hypothetical protein SpCBS45565_g07180 [Spizellomyces sp. 'palustris']
MNFHLDFEDESVENGVVCRTRGNVLVATSATGNSVTLGEEHSQQGFQAASMVDVIGEECRREEETKRTADEIREELVEKKKQLSRARQEKDFEYARCLHFQQIPALEEKLLQTLGIKETAPDIELAW